MSRERGVRGHGAKIRKSSSSFSGKIASHRGKKRYFLNLLVKSWWWPKTNFQEKLRRRRRKPECFSLKLLGLESHYLHGRLLA